jgi:hypothetical protein
MQEDDTAKRRLEVRVNRAFLSYSLGVSGEARPARETVGKWAISKWHLKARAD